MITKNTSIVYDKSRLEEILRILRLPNPVSTFRLLRREVLLPPVTVEPGSVIDPPPLRTFDYRAQYGICLIAQAKMIYREIYSEF
jgi:hypothetical protein